VAKAFKQIGGGGFILILGKTMSMVPTAAKNRFLPRNRGLGNSVS